MKAFSKVLGWVLLGAGALLIVASIVSLFISPMGFNAAPAAARLAGREAFRSAIANHMTGRMSIMRGAGLLLGGLLVMASGAVLHLLAGKNDEPIIEKNTTVESKPSAKK